ncbi:MAG: hypothetical protein KDI03_12500 [Anaerolineae bacterium]|nr:hypothetical protein [Anaerolineae bacterium]MCB0205046.1 hypothetical protein [Anaerolineae bacterium]
MTYLSRFWRRIRVKEGAELRLLAAMIMLSVGVPRLPFIHDTVLFSAQKFGQPQAWAYVFIALGLLMLITCWRGRLTPFGRTIAGLSAISFTALAAASTSATGFGVDVSFVVALMWEAGTSHGN